MAEETGWSAGGPRGKPEKEHRPLGTLLSELSSQAAEVVRLEIALARQEVSRGLRRAFAAGLWMGIGAVVALLAVPTLLAAIVLGLGALIGSHLLATLLVGGALLVGAGALAGRGAAKLRRGVKLEASVGSMRETTAWAEREVREVRGRVTGSGGPPPGEAVALRAPTPLPPAASGGRAPGHGAEGRQGPQRDEADAGGDGGSASGAEGGSSLKGLGKRLLAQIKKDDLPNQSAGVAFFAFLSFPPTLLVLFALTGFFGGETAAEWLTNRLSAALPGEAGELVDGFVEDVVHQRAPGPFSIGLLLALWAASNVFMALSRALNTAYGIVDPRAWVKQRAISLGMLLVFVLFFLSGSVVLIAGPQIASALDLAGVAEVTWNIIQWPLAILLVALAFGSAYYVLPARDQRAHLIEIYKGALFATLAWVVATLGFRLYISNFGQYTETYGFIGTIIVLLLWLWISALVVLIGGEIASELEQDARREASA